MFDRTSLHIALLLWGCIFSLIAALCMFMSRNFDRNKRRWMIWIQTTCAILLASDAVAWAYRGAMGTTGYVVVRISNFLVFALSDLLLFLYNGYMCSCMFKGRHELPRRRLAIVCVVAFLGILLVVISQFTNLYYYIDAGNYYHRNRAYVISTILPATGMLIDLSIMIEYRKNVSRLTLTSLISYMVLPLVASVIQIFCYGISLINICISISMILMFVVSMIEQNENLAKKEREAADLRISIMISQIAPHFLYNSLNSIYHLCDKDAKLAKQAISDFSDYLRHILDALKYKKLIGFEDELEFVKNYLSLEKMRFGDDLNIEYQIEATEFCVPALSIQPLVENAVKHGICQREDGGTLKFSTKEYKDHFEVVISDDGVGFDPAKMPDDGKVHVGIENVSQRLNTMCKGRLSIKSTPGKGTDVTVWIPK